MKVTLTTLLTIVVLTTTSVRSEDSPPPILPSDALAALNRNASLFSSILITGERSHRPLVPVETVLKRVQTKETAADFTQTLHFELRFQGPLFRESIEYPPGKSYTHDALYELSFDGIQYRLGYKILNNLPNSLVSIFTPRIATDKGKRDHQANGLARMEFWYLRETGFTGPQTLSTLGQSVASTILDAAAHGQIVSISEVAKEGDTFLEVIIEQPEPWQSTETFDIEAHKAYVELLNGTDKLQMRMERERRQLAGKLRVIRFWLNSTLGYAVQEKWESRKETGQTMFHTKNSDFVRVAPDGVWMPKRCVVESHAYYTAPLYISPDPLYETVMQMDQCVPGNFDGDAFRIWYDIPGATVADWTSPKATLEEADSYSVPASLDDLANTPSGARRWLIILNIVCIAGLLVFVWWRKKRIEA